MDVVSDLSDGRSGKIAYNSASPFEIHHILCKLEQAPKHPVFGHLFMPENIEKSPIPCVIACHGSRGWANHHEDHIANWLDAGIAVFRIHSFDSRHVVSTVETQMMVTHAMMLCDAFEALKLLGTHEMIDSDKIAITGWSLGGTVALYSAWSPVAEALAPEGERFAAHMPFYPAAHMRPEIQRWENVPIKILHGEDDDYTPIDFVYGLSEVANQNGAKIEIKTYPNSHHSFDSEEEMTWLANAIKLDTRTVQIDADGEMWGEIEPGQKMILNEPAQRKAAFEIVMSIGAHVGGNAETRPIVLQDSKTFLKKTLG